MTRLAATVNWELFLYRLPSEPSRARVAVWRELRRLGALPLGPAVVAVPDSGPFHEAIDAVQERVGAEGGTSYRFPLPGLDAAQAARLRAEWNELRVHEYGEIVEECETKFLKEIEFEIFRGNLTGGEAEEIEADLEKIRSWFERVAARDLFGASGRREALRALKASEAALEDFVERVYAAEHREGPSVELPTPPGRGKSALPKAKRGKKGRA